MAILNAFPYYIMPLPQYHIYGVEWDRSSSTSLTRTDDSADFEEPVPALSGGTGSSPFDECMPWSGMQRAVDLLGNEMVEIPKFWYKWTDETNSLKLQIADGPADGFHVSPAHADRGDGKGERDYIYVGRYLCNSSYKSISGQSIHVYINFDTARSGCRSLGNKYQQLDIALWQTIQMLYLVEFANWNSENSIGTSYFSSAPLTGLTDSMQYHTGTMASSRTTTGYGVQYRNLEGLWGEARQWCDGVYLNGVAYATLNYSNYNDSNTNYTNLGSCSSSDGYISNFKVVSLGDTQILLPSAINGSSTTYITDYYRKTNNYGPLAVGGWYQATSGYCGMFNLTHIDATAGSSWVVGARLQYLP